MGSNLQEVYYSLKGKDRIKLRKSEYVSIYNKDLFAHFDPMLGVPPWMEVSDNCIVGKGFGQFNAAPQLERQGVGEGSIFLFFGGFQSTSNKKISGHYIYGWMKVKKRIDTFEECSEVVDEYNLHHHPHITKAAFERNKKNYIYVPDEWLFEDLKIPGCGYFTTLNDHLLLSERKESNTATWKLRDFFYNNLTQVHQKTWLKSEDGYCTVKTGIGQEFITDLSKDGEQWLRELFTNNINNIYRHGNSKVNKEIRDFGEYLALKHILKKGERELKPVSVEQYLNRLDSMRRRGIYNEERLIDSTLEKKIQEQYKDWETYRKTIEHYLDFKLLINERITLKG
jgi:Nucleotide modification associated domain 3